METGKFTLHEKENTWNKIEGQVLVSVLSDSHAKKQSNVHQSYIHCVITIIVTLIAWLNDQTTLSVWEQEHRNKNDKK